MTAERVVVSGLLLFVVGIVLTGIAWAFDWQGKVWYVTVLSQLALPFAALAIVAGGLSDWRSPDD